MNTAKPCMSVRVSSLLAGAAIATLTLHSPAAQAAVVYANTSADTGFSYIYSSIDSAEVGDTITLGGTERLLTDASVQFFNAASVAGSYGAKLRFYSTTLSGTVGTLIGEYTQQNLSIDALDIATVTFSGLNLVVPDTLVFTVEFLGASAGLDLSQNAFQPPTIGASDDRTIIVRQTAVLVSQAATEGLGNLYFLANAVAVNKPVPEPSTLWLSAAAVLALCLRPRRVGLPGA